MRVIMTDWTGVGHKDPWYAAKKLIMAKNTRISGKRNLAAELEKMDEDALMSQLSEVAMSIRSSWEFVSVTFKVEEISRATCDQMTRSRVGCSFAVMAQRVVDNSNFEYVTPKTVIKAHMQDAFTKHMLDVALFYRSLVALGIPAQDARSVLPMATFSPVTVEYNLRALAGLVGKRRNMRAQGEYADVASEMALQVIARWPWAEMFLNPAAKNTPNLDAILRERLGDRSPVEDKQLNDALKEIDLLKNTWT